MNVSLGPHLHFYSLLLIGALLMFVLRRRSRARDRDATEENQMVQEIHAQLERMEQRVESLETILMDRVDSRVGRK